MARRPSRRRAVRGEALQARKWLVLGMDWRGVVNRSRIVPRREPSRPNQARHRPRTPLRLPTGPRCDPATGWSGAEDAVICHQCDFAGCTNPAHMRLGTNATNRVEYIARRKNVASPLADVRGAAGRTRAIAAAIRTGLANARRYGQHRETDSSRRNRGTSAHTVVMTNQLAECASVSRGARRSDATSNRGAT